MKKAVVVVGDIHGELEKLKALYEKLIAEKIDADETHLVFVGDYVDRGPDSRGVILLVNKIYREHTGVHWTSVVPLRGNHEDMMMRAIYGDHHYLNMWLHNGGIQTMKSYNANPGSHYDMRGIFGKETLDFLKHTQFGVEIGAVGIAHAGIDHEDLSVSDHEIDDLLWSRRLRMHEHNIYKYTVHGHTPMKGALVDEHVAYIDTGAVFGGKLTALVIPDADNPIHTEMRIVDV